MRHCKCTAARRGNAADTDEISMEHGHADVKVAVMPFMADRPLSQTSGMSKKFKTGWPGDAATPTDPIERILLRRHDEESPRDSDSIVLPTLQA